jgi:hypothetical protein
MVGFGNPPWRGELDKLATAPRQSAAALQHLRQGAAFPVDCACTGQEAPTALHCYASLTDSSSSIVTSRNSHFEM